MEFNELLQGISRVRESAMVSGQEAAEGIKAFGKILERFNELSDKEKHQYLIDAFSNPEIKDGAKEFAMRHPECIYNKYIQD